jgi:hypothetical protein
VLVERVLLLVERVVVELVERVDAVLLLVERVPVLRVVVAVVALVERDGAEAVVRLLVERVLLPVVRVAVAVVAVERVLVALVVLLEP